MSDRPVIWQLTPDRAKEWRQIRLEALRAAPDAFGATLSEWADRPLEDFAARLSAVETWAAGLHPGTPLAVAGWRPGWTQGTGDMGWINAVYVTPAARGRGLMDALLARIAARAADARMVRLGLHVALANAPALACYRRAGFSEIGAPFRDESGLVAIEMQRPLPAPTA